MADPLPKRKGNGSNEVYMCMNPDLFRLLGIYIPVTKNLGECIKWFKLGETGK